LRELRLHSFLSRSARTPLPLIKAHDRSHINATAPIRMIHEAARALHLPDGSESTTLNDHLTIEPTFAILDVVVVDVNVHR
jgi:hypothetical protein